MGGGRLAVEQPSGSEESGAGAHGGGPFAVGGAAVRSHSIRTWSSKHRYGVPAARDHDETGIGQRLWGVGRDHRQSAVAADGIERSRKEVDFNVGPAADHFIGTDQVECGEVGI